MIESKLFMDNQQFDGSLYMYKVLQHFKFFLHYTFVIPIYFLPQDKFNIVHVPYRKINLKLFFLKPLNCLTAINILYVPWNLFLMLIKNPRWPWLAPLWDIHVHVQCTFSRHIGPYGKM